MMLQMIPSKVIDSIVVIAAWNMAIIIEILTIKCVVRCCIRVGQVSTENGIF